jgi:hypothetical protein
VREQPNPARSWAGYLVGILVESAYVAVMVAVAALVAWAVMPR